MPRPTQIYIDALALSHNVERIKQLAPGKKIIAMVKANAYGCGLKVVVPILDGQVYAFGVACLEEALTIRQLGSKTPCVIFQGVFSADELPVLVENKFSCVIHNHEQVQWLLQTPLSSPLKVWVKVNTGMHRLGFEPQEITALLPVLQNCPWVDKAIDLMTHLSTADEVHNTATERQLAMFNQIDSRLFSQKSIANSAGILYFPESHADVVRPGIMLYGVSPSTDFCGTDLGLLPVMRFMSKITTIHHYPAGTAIGYGGSWKTTVPSIIGIVAAGYGDGYPRHVAAGAYVLINGSQALIAGRISMDMMAVDLTHCSDAKLGDIVELWGAHLPVEKVASWAGTIGYELLCQIAERVRVQ